jgi:hypothetical protein
VSKHERIDLLLGLIALTGGLSLLAWGLVKYRASRRWKQEELLDALLAELGFSPLEDPCPLASPAPFDHEEPRKGTAPSTPGRRRAAPRAGGGFHFELIENEAIRDRVVRCCHQALESGPIGNKAHHDTYRDFIACNQEATSARAESLAQVRTSCALFVRAIRAWCGAEPTGPYRPGTAMFTSMGKVSFTHSAFVANEKGAEPRPGDYFYISSRRESNDGHTGIFLRRTERGSWVTAEGGGRPDGTLCQLRERRLAGHGFADDSRRLWGWFDIEKVGLPALAPMDSADLVDKGDVG